MGCLPSSVSRDAEPDEGERITTESSTDRSSSSHWQELNELIDYMEVVVMQQGQKCDLGGCLCVVLEGEVERSSGTHSNDESGGVSQKHIAGAVFGQVGLFDNSG